jgi:prepilin-type N-terminal cleavage/methylation domain-containing protein
MRKGEVSARGGFSLTELLVVIAVIALLVGVLVVALAGVSRTAGRAAEQQALRTMGIGLTQFKTDHGFAVPLVFDGYPMTTPGPKVLDRPGVRPLDSQASNLPVVENANAPSPVPFVAAYSASDDLDFLRGGRDSGGANVLARGGWQDPRFSRASLPIYLAGWLPARVDGADGSDMSQPRADGSFAGVGAGGSAKRFGAYAEAGRGGITIAQGIVGPNEQTEFGAAAGPGNTGTDRALLPSFVDEEGRPIRYYRWARGRNGADVTTAGGRVGDVAVAADLNIPAVFQDAAAFVAQRGDRSVDATGGRTALRSASWGIVTPGVDGLYGTETDAVIQAAYPGVPIEQARAEAMSDNVTEVGE